ncbi:hypothetical protein V8G54_003026 [Vigna mungo]|uniref:AB hydrolase-1 domain-containing protein n=1 Tax=Vigna mungo TaxID=3915 RepID=A0AAQ3SBD2_VIGMU
MEVGEVVKELPIGPLEFGLLWVVRFLENPIMSSCVKPMMQNKENPIVLLHGFDSSCLEWRYTYPLLEEAGYETWAVDILGWGFCDLEKLPSCDVVSKRDHFYQFWKSHIKKAMILVGPSLGSAFVIDFAINYPETVEKLVLIDASVYAEGTGNLATLPKAAAYAGAYLLKSIPLRVYANLLCFTNLPFSTSLDWTNVGRLHCLFPWWEDATVDFMTSGGYNVVSQIKKAHNIGALLNHAFNKELMIQLGQRTSWRYHKFSKKIAKVKIAKEALNILKLSYKGVEKAKKFKLQSMHREYEKYEMSGLETSDHVVTTIIESYNTDTMTIAELRGGIIKQKTLIIWGENDRIISNKLGVQLHCELPDAIIRQIPDCGHLPHVERPDSVFKLIVEFVQSKSTTENECVSPL